MKLVPREVPGPQSVGNAFTDLVSHETLSQLKRSPGVQFQICTDDGKPVVVTTQTASAIAQACKRPYRLTTRRAGKKSERLVWVANDPAYWARIDEARNAKKDNSHAS